MRPSKLKTGARIRYQSFGGEWLKAVFIRRQPAQCGRPAVNYLRFPDFVGLDGPEDDGVCQVSDYDLSRRGQYPV